MRNLKPKNKIARREGIDMGFKTPGSKSHASLLKRMNIQPGEHGVSRRKKQSEQRKQLREKQKLRLLFGLSERQLKNYFNKAKEKKGNTSYLLIKYLEKRVDNIVYRLGFAPTKNSARQLVVHKHIKVNDKVVNSPSYQVKIGDNIELADEKTKKIPYIEVQLSNKDIVIPKWLKIINNKGKVIAEPASEDIEKQVDLRSVVEFYSR